MRFVVLPKPGTVDGVPYTLLNLANFALSAAPQFNDGFEAAARGATLAASRDRFLREQAPELPEEDLANVVPQEGAVWALEDEPWRKFCEWCDNPMLPNGSKGFPVRPASMLVPHIEALKAAKTEPPKRALPPAAPSDEDADELAAPAVPPS